MTNSRKDQIRQMSDFDGLDVENVGNMIRKMLSNPLLARLRAELDEARRRTDALFDIVRPEALYGRPIPERHRIIFYLGHLEAFDWNMICGASFGAKPLHKEFERLFAFGIDPVDGKLPQDNPSDWPSVDAVRRYNTQVRAAVDDSLKKADFSKSGQRYMENGLIFSVAVEHRLMHLETLSYMLHWLPFETKHEVRSPILDSDPQPTQRKTRVPAGKAVLGAHRGNVFGWDNEFEGHAVDVPEFEIDVYKVSNGDFLQFVEEGGYEQPSLWTADDFSWVNSEGIRHPRFWRKGTDRWFYRAMFAEIPLPLSWPVFVSHAEASAYARWKGKSLPTEAEFHRASSGQHARGNSGFRRWDPVPVHSNESAASAFGVVEMVGNGWEWTSTPFAPFAGFERFPFYPGYSADFFDGKHFVLKGASPRTADRLARPAFRNWFQPRYPYIYSGFRCVQR
jgi:gamma-glutamyl hercynylcysteine S-oxide synthase